MIEFSEVSLVSGGTTLLTDFSWQMPDPGVYMLLGGNGTGKSLLANMLCGRTRPDKGSVSIMGEAASRIGGQVWAADAAMAIREDESVEEYIEFELSCSGAAGTAVDDCLRMLSSLHFNISDKLLSQLPHYELLLVQIAIAGFVEGPLRILDGHLTYLDDNYCKVAAQMLRSLALKQERFLLLTASRVASELPDLKAMWLLSRQLPVQLQELQSAAGITTAMQRVTSSTAISVYYRNADLSPRELTSGESYRVLNRLEGGLNLELAGTLDECLAELAARGIEIRRIDLQKP